MTAMNGHVITGTSICVDYWLWKHDEKYLHFLTHLHADHTFNLKSTFCGNIYTSPFNAWLVKRWFHIDPKNVVALSVGDSHVVYDPASQGHFCVTVLDANHCPGSVMFLFKGSFGNILYTGDFRYTPGMLEHPMMKSIIENENLDRLYLDNTFAAEHCSFPPRKQALQEVLSLIRNHPEHYILLGVRKLGKEEVLQAIALDLNEKVLVSEEKLAILNYLDFRPVFTTNPEESRIIVKEMHQIKNAYVYKLQEERGPVLTILVTAMYSVAPPGSKCFPKLENTSGLVHLIPYSDHSCHSELVKFVSQLKPYKIYPIVDQKIKNESLKYSSNLLDNLKYCSWQNSVMPQSILKLARYQESNKGVPEELTCESNLLRQDIVSSLMTEDDSSIFNESRHGSWRKEVSRTEGVGCGNQSDHKLGSSQITEDDSSCGLDNNAIQKRDRNREQPIVEIKNKLPLNEKSSEPTICFTSSVACQNKEEEDYTVMSDDDLTQLATPPNSQPEGIEQSATIHADLDHSNTSFERDSPSGLVKKLKFNSPAAFKHPSNRYRVSEDFYHLLANLEQYDKSDSFCQTRNEIQIQCSGSLLAASDDSILKTLTDLQNRNKNEMESNKKQELLPFSGSFYDNFNTAYASWKRSVKNPMIVPVKCSCKPRSVQSHTKNCD